MALRRADLLHGAVAQGKVHLPSSAARSIRGKAGAGEQALGHSVVTPVFFQASEPAAGETALAAEASDQAQFLERTEVGEGRGGPHVQARGDVLEAGTAGFALPGRDHPKSLDLPMGQLLKCLHNSEEKSRVYIRHPNY